MANLNITVNEFKFRLNQEQLNIVSEKEIPYGYQLKVADEKEQVTVNIYCGKAGIKYVVLGKENC